MAAATSDHVWQESTDAADHAEDVDVELPFPVRDGNLLERPAEHHAGVIHQDVDLPHLRQRDRSEAVDVRVAGDITTHGERAATEGGDRRARLPRALVMNAGQYTVAAVPRHAQRGTAADAAGPAGDHGHPALDFHSSPHRRRGPAVIDVP